MDPLKGPKFAAAATCEECGKVLHVSGNVKQCADCEAFFNGGIILGQLTIAAGQRYVEAVVNAQVCP